MDKGFCPFIYALTDPHEAGHVRYVGMAMKPRRPYEHARNATKSTKHSHLFHWIRLLRAEGREPSILILEELPPGCSRTFVGTIEQMYIDSLRRIGHRLTNVSAGGWGGNVGDEGIQKAAASNRGKKRSDETRARMRAAANRSPEVRARMSVAAKKRGCPPKMRSALLVSAAARVGKKAKHPHSVETRAKIGAKQYAHWETLTSEQRSAKTAEARQVLQRDVKSGRYLPREEPSNG